jgi:hypothetical protein
MRDLRGMKVVGRGIEDAEEAAGARAHHESSLSTSFLGHFWMRQKRPLRHLRWPSGSSVTKARPHLGIFLHIRSYPSTSNL